MFKASQTVHLGSGDRILFLSDCWLNGQSICYIAPSLIRLVSLTVRSKRTVQEALLNGQWIEDISGALEAHVLVEYLRLWDRLSAVYLTPGWRIISSGGGMGLVSSRQSMHIWLSSLGRLG